MIQSPRIIVSIIRVVLRVLTLTGAEYKAVEIKIPMIGHAYSNIIFFQFVIILEYTTWNVVSEIQNCYGNSKFALVGDVFFDF